VLSVLFGEQFNNLRQILEFKLSPNAKILDVTYGHGKLWQSVNKTTHVFNVVKNDIDPETPAEYHYSFDDLEMIPQRDFDAALYDPPYMYGKSSYIFYNRKDEDWTQNKTKWTIKDQIRCAIVLNNVLPIMLKPNGLLVVKIMDTRFKGKLIPNHKLLMDALTSFELVDVVIYVRLGVGVFKNRKSSQTAHGFYLIFQSSKESVNK